MLSPLWHDVENEVALITLSSGMSFEWKLNAPEMRDKLFHVHGSKSGSVVDVDPELCDGLFRVLTLGEFDHRAYDLLLVSTASALFGVVTEHPCVGLAFSFEQTQRTSLVSLRLHADDLLCTRTDGCGRVYIVYGGGEGHNSHKGSDLLFFPDNHSFNSLSKKRQNLSLATWLGPLRRFVLAHPWDVDLRELGS